MLPQLDISNFLSQIFWLAIVFCILYVFIKKKFIPNIENVVNKRSSEISSILQEARINNEKSKELIDQALLIEKSTRFNILKLENNIIDKIREESNAKLEKISKDLAKDYKKAKNQYESQFEALSKEIHDISKDSLNILSKKIENN